jgi:small-conductance mechanosensitive channel
LLKKVTPFILALFFVLILISAWKFPAWTPVFGIAFLVLSLALAMYGIFERHRGGESARRKIAWDVLVLILTILLVAFLGGLAGLFANHYVSLRFGVTVGFVSALAVGFTVGYLVKKRVGKLTG